MPEPSSATFDTARLCARDLACTRGGRAIFADLSFDLEAGEGLLLRGPNGCGKSTLLRLIAGFVPACGGVLEWKGEDVLADPFEIRQELHYLGHAETIRPLLTVEENLAFTTGLLGSSGASARALQAFDLESLADTAGRFLSAGQRRRLGLARLVATSRPLWLMDEPGVGLDRASRDRLEGLIHRHREAGGIAIVASHGDVSLEDPLVLDFAR